MHSRRSPQQTPRVACWARGLVTPVGRGYGGGFRGVVAAPAPLSGADGVLDYPACGSSIAAVAHHQPASHGQTWEEAVACRVTPVQDAHRTAVLAHSTALTMPVPAHRASELALHQPDTPTHIQPHS